MRFVRGDVVVDSAINLSDAVGIFSRLFLGADAGECDDAADADDSGEVVITDGIYILNYLFLGGPSPRPPFPECDAETGDDALSCEQYAGDCP